MEEDEEEEEDMTFDPLIVGRTVDTFVSLPADAQHINLFLSFEIVSNFDLFDL